jgi:hypothetical protein
MYSVGGGQGHGGALFDHLEDGLRGTRGIVLNMPRQPEKLFEALDAAAARKIHEIHHSSDYTRLGRCPVAGLELHKGADGLPIIHPTEEAVAEMPTG